MIAYVDSPFQLLQMYELNEQRKSFCKVYIRLNGKMENDKQLKSLVKLFGLADYRFIRVVKGYEKAYYYFIFLFLSIMNTQIIIGDANCFLFKLLKQFLPKSKFLLLDDGVATINDVEINKHYSRFTIFPDYVKDSLTNDFKAIKKLIGEKKVVLKHVIVGAKFIDAGICSELSYDTALSKIISNLNLDEVSCVYIPHRGETDAQISRLKNKFPIEIIRTDYPIELLALETGVYPATISHTLSTAVYSMKKIYTNVDMYTCKIPSSEVLLRKESIERLYQQLEDEAFTFFLK
ncbi:hypothetical protein [Pseudoalteromonas sp. BSi20439]|uniref:hypothetical protein n=1 Tax=Pseudoalteromonas sp. BSi20439 TaxID=420915 RepID=UPI000231B7B5|nr:hypothetical protein [Pseudoalteromonas sp. BSi20439]GAA72652.1 hypothetical protein P20439_2746 [Pseudoalteromonas sp. BSi20439]